MKNDTPQQQLDYQELRVLLSTLRIEATPEAHFEERFLYDFRERLVREAACRPARMLLWEHLVQVFQNWGGRRLILGASSFGIGMLFMGALTWQHVGSAARTALSQHCVLGGDATSLQPGAVQDVARTNVSRSSGRKKPYTERLMALRSLEPAYLASGEDDADSLYSFSASGANTGTGMPMSELLPYLAQ